MSSDNQQLRLSSTSVLAFVENSAKATNQGHALPSVKQISALIQYTVQEMAKAETPLNQQSVVDQFVAVLDTVVERGCEKAVQTAKAALKTLYEACELADDPESAKRREAITALQKTIEEKYSGIDQLDGNVTLIMLSVDALPAANGLQELHSVAEVDQQLHRLLSEVYDLSLSATPRRTQEVDEALATLWQQVENSPHLVAR